MPFTEKFKILLDKKLNQIEVEQYEDLTKREAMIPQIFKEVDDPSAWWEYASINGFGDIPSFGGSLEYLDNSPGYMTRIEPAEFAAGAIMDRKLIDAKKWPVLDDMASMLMDSAFRTRETKAAGVFGKGFSTAFDFMSYSEENVALFSSSHTSKSGAPTTTGFDNYSTDALNEISLEKMRIKMNRVRRDDGARAFTNFDTLIVPDSLAKMAYEITQTPKGLHTANGTENFQHGRWNVIVYKLQDDYSTKNWFIADSKMLKKHMMWINAVKWETKRSFEDFETLAIKTRIYGRWGYGWTNWRCVAGSQVS